MVTLGDTNGMPKPVGVIPEWAATLQSRLDAHSREISMIRIKTQQLEARFNEFEVKPVLELSVLESVRRMTRIMEARRPRSAIPFIAGGIGFFLGAVTVALVARG